MKFDIEVLKQYESEGWVMSHHHKFFDLIILNYTQKTQYESKWDDITLNCRGTVIDSDGNVIAKGFSKFFNFEEKRTTVPGNNLCKVYEKLDGSYIQLFNYRDEWIINSKGSFYSDHVGWATQILNSKYPQYKDLNKKITYCFELIHPKNRIVVNYEGKEDLILIGCFEKGVEDEKHFLSLEELKFNICKPYITDFKYENIKNTPHLDAEGFVIQFTNKERCKIKFEDYIKLHRIMTEVSSYRIYEALKDGVDLNIWLEGVPDELFNWIKIVEAEILNNYNLLKYTILNKQMEVYSKTIGFNDKEFALYIKDNIYKSYLFRLRKEQEIGNMIWKEVKPELKYPFKNEN